MTLVAVMCANVMFRAKSVAAAMLILSGMFGLRGVSDNFSAAGLDVWAAILASTAIVAYFPNTQQIMSRFDPAYNWNEWRDVAPSRIAFTWKPNAIGLILAGVVLFFGVMFVQRGQAVFLYFNF